MQFNFYKILWIVYLTLLTAFTSFEVHLTLFALGFPFVFVPKVPVSKTAVQMILILLGIVLMGLLTSIFNQTTMYDRIKDLLYFLKPVLGLLLGYGLIKRINDMQFLLRSMVIVALGFSIIHTAKILIQIDVSEATVEIIRKNGIDNLLELFALAILISSFKNPFFDVFKNTYFKHLALFLIGISFTLYFSRMMFVGLILFVLAFTGLAKLTKRGFSYFVVLCMAVAVFYAYLFSTEIKRDQPGIQSFLYKMKIAPAEIFLPSKEINEKNHAELWDHWRAYEAQRAIGELNEDPMNYIAGKGFGSLIDLGFVAPVNEEGMRYIPHIHNGYIYVLYKTGIFALISYLILLSFLYLQSYNKSDSVFRKNTQNLIAGIGLFFIFSSLITTGIYNEHEFYMFFLGGFLFHLQHSEK